MEYKRVPLYETVRPLVGNRELLLLHSHSHSDHYSGDSQFENKPGVSIVGPSFKVLTAYFTLDNWPLSGLQRWP